MRVSPSQLKVWKECEQAWYYSYVDELKPKMARSRALDIGTYTHELMHVIYQYHKAFPDVKYGSDEVLDMIVARVKKDIEERNLDTINITAIVLKLITKYVTWQSARIDTGITVIGVEKEFKVQMTEDGLILHGFIDLVYRDASGKIRIRDHKTSGQKNSWSEKKIKLNEQFLMYALAMTLELGEPVLPVEVNFVNTYQYANNKTPPNNELFNIYRHVHSTPVVDSYAQNLINMHEQMVAVSEKKRVPIRNFHEGCGSCRFFELCNLETKGLDSTNTKSYLFKKVDKDG